MSDLLAICLSQRHTRQTLFVFQKSVRGPGEGGGGISGPHLGQLTQLSNPSRLRQHNLFFYDNASLDLPGVPDQGLAFQRDVPRAETRWQACERRPHLVLCYQIRTTVLLDVCVSAGLHLKPCFANAAVRSDKLRLVLEPM